MYARDVQKIKASKEKREKKSRQTAFIYVISFLSSLLLVELVCHAKHINFIWSNASLLAIN